jgi:hypothetical protein
MQYLPIQLPSPVPPAHTNASEVKEGTVTVRVFPGVTPKRGASLTITRTPARSPGETSGEHVLSKYTLIVALVAWVRPFTYMGTTPELPSHGRLKAPHTSSFIRFSGGTLLLQHAIRITLWYFFSIYSNLIGKYNQKIILKNVNIRAWHTQQISGNAS